MSNRKYLVKVTIQSTEWACLLIFCLFISMTGKEGAELLYGLLRVLIWQSLTNCNAISGKCIILTALVHGFRIMVKGNASLGLKRVWECGFFASSVSLISSFLSGFHQHLEHPMKPTGITALGVTSCFCSKEKFSRSHKGGSWMRKHCGQSWKELNFLRSLNDFVPHPSSLGVCAITIWYSINKSSRKEIRDASWLQKTTLAFLPLSLLNKCVSSPRTTILTHKWFH